MKADIVISRGMAIRVSHILRQLAEQDARTDDDGDRWYSIVLPAEWAENQEEVDHEYMLHVLGGGQ
jgi:hypothetical protein